jgi:endonuclease-3 related protein
VAGAHETLLDVYGRLYAAYGSQSWWPGDSAFEVIVGAILTQSAAWTNVEKALNNMKAAGALSPEAIDELPQAELARLVRPSGYYNAKARKLKAFVTLLDRVYGGDFEAMLTAPTEELREALLSTHGIGPETADSILLYAAGRPVFVIDTYTRRTFSRLGFGPEQDTYDGWQTLFAESLPLSAPLFNEYHALIVRLAKSPCRAKPVCGECPLSSICPVALAAA